MYSTLKEIEVLANYAHALIYGDDFDVLMALLAIAALDLSRNK